MSARFASLGIALSLTACGAAPALAPTPTSTPAPVPAPALAPAPTADVDVREDGSAFVHGTTLPFDGLEEALAWPALDKALPPRRTGDVLTVQVARRAPTIDLLRAAWTLRQADLRVQSLDENGVMRVVELKARREGPPAPGCHLAAFLRPDGSLRVASPGGPIVIAGETPAAILAQSLSDERQKPGGCTFKYVAFGAESDTAPWGPLFDVILAVDAAKAAGDARFVLGQAMHASAPAASAP